MKVVCYYVLIFFQAILAGAIPMDGCGGADFMYRAGNISRNRDGWLEEL